MKMKVQKWGNSLGIRLPKIFAVQMGMDAGNEVEIDVKDNTIIIRNEETLDALVARITPDNLHKETDTGDAIGKEIW